MSFLKNGTMMVVIGTAIAAALMLMTGREDKGEVQVVGQQKESSKIEEKGQKITPEVTQKVQGVEEKTTSVSNTLESVSTAAIVTAGVISTTSSADATSSSNETIKASTPSATNNNALLEVDSEQQVGKNAELDNAQNEQVAAPEGLYKKSDDAEQNEIKDDKENETANKLKESEELASKKSIAERKPPIWLDQKLGEFKSVDTRDIEFIIMPNSADDLQGSNPKQVVTSKVGKFLPAAIPDNYNYQQMPMFNGGYYIAPMPSYLMPSVLPNNVVE